MMKSWCRSAPFWNTESGIFILGFSSAEKQGLAIFFRDMSVDCWRFFAQFAGGGLKGWFPGFLDEEEVGAVGAGTMDGAAVFREAPAIVFC